MGGFDAVFVNLSSQQSSSATDRHIYVDDNSRKRQQAEKVAKNFRDFCCDLRARSLFGHGVVVTASRLLGPDLSPQKWHADGKPLFFMPNGKSA
jgi:hypothetical protein